MRCGKGLETRFPLVTKQNVQYKYVPLCVFRLILQSWKQSQYQTMESRNEFLTKWQVVLFTDVQ